MTIDRVPDINAIYAPPKAYSPGAQPVDRPASVSTPFFSVSPLKLVVMTVATLGIYEGFWFYANWRCIQRRGQSKISPLARAIFTVFFCHSLFTAVRDTAASAQVAARFSPGLLAAGWIITTLLWKLPDPLWLISMGAVFFLVPVQVAMNDINRKLAPGHDPNRRFTALNIVGIILGGGLLVLAIVGTFMSPG